ncbi:MULTISPECIES: LuxR C-terminal-related transcriptional regulator [unclassified Sphingomonas]|uniref:LuxR C-terminal-related transcriptional regulator n=1 Tax=unclassified Sphingomonas TaxID=196159 RepID=UPI0017850822|nr:MULTISPECIES: LuxR C-terminal-related transcriptional regulator [unclassified Sphingomonas]MBD8641495.1 RNA polymerase subunit sigma-70 [Sphingomonas sp. CFBP 13733]MBD8701819.1 RNA polymerase subunit sigma-70 [Sphingomonas sp. CFBP 13714]
MLTIEPGKRPAQRTPPTPTPGVSTPERVALLTDRQRSYLRLVLQNRSSKEIAAATGSSHRAVDKQLLKANNILGVPTRYDAARLLAEYDGGVEPLPPANDLPSAPPTLPLPLPLPTAGAAANMLTWKQVAFWTAIISIVTPLGLTAAGMAIVTLLLLLGLKPL